MGGNRFGRENRQALGGKCFGVKGGMGPLEKHETAGFGIKCRHFSSRPVQVSDCVVSWQLRVIGRLIASL
jgi:hypothetical protein